MPSKSDWSRDMPELESSHSAPTPSSGTRAQLTRGRSNTASRPRPQHVFSAQHLDDVSNYHAGDHDPEYQHDDNETEYSDELEQVRNEDYGEAASEGKEEVPEVRMGVLDMRDLEANLEKKETTRSIKDPNLVRAIDYNFYNMAVLLIVFAGIVGWARRPQQPKKLEIFTEVGGDNRCIVLHFHLACLFVNGGTCSHIDLERIWHNE